jgi:hypothetical protein
MRTLWRVSYHGAKVGNEDFMATMHVCKRTTSTILIMLQHGVEQWGLYGECAYKWCVNRVTLYDFSSLQFWAC